MEWIDNPPAPDSDDELETESVFDWYHKRKARMAQAQLRQQYENNVNQQMAYVRSFKKKPDEVPINSAAEAVDQRFSTHPPKLKTRPAKKVEFINEE